MAKKQELEMGKATKFPKDTLLQAKQFANRRDILSGVMQDGELLTLVEAEARIDTYMKGKVR